MDRPTKCPECGSGNLIPNAPVTAPTVAGPGWLTVEVDARPDALLFKGKRRGIIEATVCGGCGLVRLYAHNPAELLAAYREQANS